MRVCARPYAHLTGVTKRGGNFISDLSRKYLLIEAGIRFVSLLLQLGGADLLAQNEIGEGIDFWNRTPLNNCKRCSLLGLFVQSSVAEKIPPSSFAKQQSENPVCSSIVARRRRRTATKKCMSVVASLLLRGGKRPIFGLLVGGGKTRFLLLLRFLIRYLITRRRKKERIGGTRFPGKKEGRE